MEREQRRLELTIRLRDDGYFDCDVYEPESGEISKIHHPFSPDEHPEFNESIGEEIYSWLKLWADEMEDEE